MKHEDDTINKIKFRERKHFSSKKIKWLKSLEDDSSILRKKILEQILMMWDKDLKFIKPILYENKIVLDAGCGSLRYTSYMKDKNAKLCVGGDLTIKFIKRGLSKNYLYVYDSKVDPSNNKTIQLDCENMAFKENSFDLIMFFHSIHHIAQKNRAFAQSTKILKNGGHIIISDLNGAHVLRGIGDMIGKRTGIMSPDEKAPRPEKIIEILKKNNFEILEVYYMNPFSEILFHIFNIVGMKSEKISLLLKTSFFIINPVENLIEKTFSGVFPNLFWRYLIIAKKVAL